MSKAYKAAFLVPVLAKKVLKDEGWFFSTEDRVPPEVLTAVVDKFALEKREEYGGVSVYVGEKMKVNVMRDDVGLIEQIYFQFFERTSDEVKSLFRDEGFCDVEFFVP